MKEGRNNGKFVVKSSLWDFFISLCLSDWDDDCSSFPHPITTPLLVATVLIIGFLKLTGISYKAYNIGGTYLSNLIVPSTVVLGIPLYKSFHLMKHHAKSILLSSFLAVVVNTVFTSCLWLSYLE